jgi:hypothetical protein
MKHWKDLILEFMNIPMVYSKARIAFRSQVLQLTRAEKEHAGFIEQTKNCNYVDKTTSTNYRSYMLLNMSNAERIKPLIMQTATDTNYRMCLVKKL